MKYQTTSIEIAEKRIFCSAVWDFSLWMVDAYNYAFEIWCDILARLDRSVLLKSKPEKYSILLSLPSEICKSRNHLLQWKRRCQKLNYWWSFYRWDLKATMFWWPVSSPGCFLHPAKQTRNIAHFLLQLNSAKTTTNIYFEKDEEKEGGGAGKEKQTEWSCCVSVAACVFFH